MKIGFGIWRFFLALMVAISHLWSGMIDGSAAYIFLGAMKNLKKLTDIKDKNDVTTYEIFSLLNK